MCKREMTLGEEIKDALKTKKMTQVETNWLVQSGMLENIQNLIKIQKMIQ